MKRQAALILLLIGVSLTLGAGLASAQPYSSYVTGTQVHSSGNHWGNSNTTHHLLDTVTIPFAIQVSRASWNPVGKYTSVPSLINIYDAGLHCLAGPCGNPNGTNIGKLYTHTGPLLSSQTNPNSNTQQAVLLVADANTVCQSYPCTLPPGTYSLTTGSSEIASDTMSLWSDGSVLSSGAGADYHIGNSFGNVANAFVAASVTTQPLNVAVGGSTQVTLTGTMLNGQPFTGTHASFAAGMQVLVAGLTSGVGGPGDPCNGIHPLDSANGSSATGTLVYTVSGNRTCTLATNTTQTCNGISGPTGFGAGCVGAGLAPVFDQIIVDQGNGYYCYADGTECARSNFVGPAGTQSGAHSVGIMIY